MKEWNSSGVIMLSLDDIPVRAKEKLEEFANLPSGWHFGEGGPLGDEVLEMAREIVDFALDKNLRDTNAFPGVDGECQLVFYEGKDEIEITIEADKKITFCLERNGQEPTLIEGLDISDVKGKLTEYTKEKCHSYASSIQSTSIPRRSGSATWPSRTPPTVPEYLSSVRNVSKTWVSISASILENTIPPCTESHQFFGSFQNTSTSKTTLQ